MKTLDELKDELEDYKRIARDLLNENERLRFEFAEERLKNYRIIKELRNTSACPRCGFLDKRR